MCACPELSLWKTASEQLLRPFCKSSRVKQNDRRIRPERLDEVLAGDLGQSLLWAGLRSQPNSENSGATQEINAKPGKSESKAGPNLCRLACELAESEVGDSALARLAKALMLAIVMLYVKYYTIYIYDILRTLCYSVLHIICSRHAQHEWKPCLLSHCQMLSSRHQTQDWRRRLVTLVDWPSLLCSAIMATHGVVQQVGCGDTLSVLKAKPRRIGRAGRL